jgi:hypothetical protein
MQDATFDELGSMPSTFIFIARGWLHTILLFGPKTTESNSGLPSVRLYVKKTTPGRRLSKKLRTKIEP